MSRDSQQDDNTPAGDPGTSADTATGHDRKPGPDSADPSPARPGTGNGNAQEARGSDDELSRLQARVTELEEESAGYRDQFLRARAELENVRRRAENEVSSARRYGIERFAAELLPVKDSLELARTVEIRAGDADALEKMREGLDLTLKLIDGVFEKFDIIAVDPQPGDKLDPSRHQAMSMQESSEIPANHVVSCVQRGYMLHDRLLRPAMVIVAREAAEKGEGAGGRAS